MVTQKGTITTLLKLGTVPLLVVGLLAGKITLAGDLDGSFTVKPPPEMLRIIDGKVTGSFNNSALEEILKMLVSQYPFDYQVKRDLLDHPVSGNFDGTPLVIVIKKLLRPFNYYMIASPSRNTIDRIVVTSLVDHHVSFKATSSVSRLINHQKDTVALTKRVSEKTAPRTRLSAELLHQFEPLQEPGTEENGPRPAPGTVVKDLPYFEVTINDTGPVDR